MITEWIRSLPEPYQEQTINLLRLYVNESHIVMPLLMTALILLFLISLYIFVSWMESLNV